MRNAECGIKEKVAASPFSSLPPSAFLPQIYHENLKERTLQFALRVLEVVDAIPLTTPKGRNIADQLCRSGTSVAANYRAAARAKSTADFIHKMGTVEEEADETLFWLEISVRSGMLAAIRLQSLIQEADEIIAIIVSSINTAKRNRSK